MPGPAETFRTIHRLRRFARDLQEQIDRIPIQLRAHQARVSRQEELYKQAQDAVKHLKVLTHDKESTLKATHAQVAKYQTQMGEASSTKEYQALKSEIAAAREKARLLEDEILTGMAGAEEKAAQLPGLEKSIREAREEYARLEKEAGGRRAELEAQLAGAREQLREAETQVPADVRTQYNRVVNARGADALAAVHGRACAACHSEVTAQQHNELQQDLFVVCKSCGRILYLPE